ncbi:hypothetical protein [Vibrio parahaemolyticus]|uniref:hypothetical protein n=1 Tax=Vibrio parahaemolyticus TaxID=670 RepID=UPI003D7E7D76
MQHELAKHRSKMDNIKKDIDFKLRLMNGTKAFIVLTMAWVICGFYEYNWLESFEKCLFTFVMILVWSGLSIVLLFNSEDEKLIDYEYHQACLERLLKIQNIQK